MTKKILLTILLLSLAGCTQKFGVEEKISDNLRLKVAEEKIIKSEDVNEKKCLKYATSTVKMATGTSIVLKCLEETELNYKKYEYISEEIATNTPYFSNNSNISSAEYLPKRKDGKQPIVFYSPNSDKKWFKDDNNKIYRIKKATTTLEAFEMQTKSTFLQSFLNIFVNKTIAATSYTSNSTYTPDCDGTVEVLVIGGGGGGGANRGGGGGGGGYQYNASFAVTVQEYTVTVGDGGGAHTNGDNSSFSTITATGGGYGADVWGSGNNGGSGGGASGNGTPGTGSQGNDGGNGVYKTDSNNGSGGGGGGASADGSNGTLTTGGNGGDGTANSISGSSVYYGGGGGGSVGNTGTGGSGGNGGGGHGEDAGNVNGTAGTDGRGGGGGGAANNGAGKSGGSGVVIISFNGSCTVAEEIDEAYVISHR